MQRVSKTIGISHLAFSTGEVLGKGWEHLGAPALPRCPGQQMEADQAKLLSYEAVGSLPLPRWLAQAHSRPHGLWRFQGRSREDLLLGVWTPPGLQ